MRPSAFRARKYASDKSLQERLAMLRGEWGELEAERKILLREKHELIVRAKRTEDYTIANLSDLTQEAVKKLKADGWKVFTARNSKEGIEYVRESIGKGSIALMPSPETTEAAIMPGFALSNKVTIASVGHMLCEMKGIAPLHPLFPIPVAEEDEIKKAEDKIEEGIQKAKNVIVSGLVVSADGTVMVGGAERGLIEKSDAKDVFIILGIDRLVKEANDASDVAEVLAMASGGMLQPDKLERGPGVAYHIILLDNGRLALSSSEYSEALKCIHCYSCSLECPAYRALGNLYGSPEMSGIGVVLTGYKEGIKRATDRGLFYCLLCGRCSRECPMDLDIPRMIRALRRKADVSNLRS